jgi:hypothetical protein
VHGNNVHLFALLKFHAVQLVNVDTNTVSAVYIVVTVAQDKFNGGHPVVCLG